MLSTSTLRPIDERPAVPPREAAIAVEHLTKRFALRRQLKDIVRAPFEREYVKALDDVSLQIAPGEFFGLLGPNGAGKTTLFKTLATLVTPDAGRVTIAGFDVVRQDAAVRRVLTPVIADERSLRWRLSAYENVRLFAVLYGIPANAVETRTREVLEIVNLHDTGRKLVGEFSSGMKQRLMVARALLPHPRILLLDEPTRGLDPLSARTLRAFLRDVICREQGCTVALATHNTEEAFELCDRLAIMNKGRLLAAGRTQDLVIRYADDRYRLLTQQPEDPALARTSAAAHKPLIGRTDADGWTEVELSIPGGNARAAEVLGYLVRQGPPISRFEAVSLSLAELIERVLREASVD
jgi:ABC-2 type transport system ATP-binding protein